MVNLTRRFAGERMSVISVNGHPALMIEGPYGPAVLQIVHRGGRVTKVLALMNAEKLAALDNPVELT